MLCVAFGVRSSRICVVASDILTNNTDDRPDFEPSTGGSENDQKYVPSRRGKTPLTNFRPDEGGAHTCR